MRLHSLIHVIMICEILKPNAMQIFRKLVRNKQHMALNASLCANNEYFYHVM